MTQKPVWLYRDASAAGVISNAYYNNGYKRAENGGAGRFYIDVTTGDLVVETAATGSADSAISFSERFRIQGNGELSSTSNVRPLDVKRFGALGDGTTNDTTAIANALAVLKAQGGGTLYFPAGTYLTDGIDLDGPINSWKHIRLLGETKHSALEGGSIIKARAGTGGGAPATQDFVVRFAGAIMSAEHITFDGNFATTTAVVHFDYQTFGSGLEKCFVTRTYAPAPVTVTPDNTTDTFNAIGHGFVDGDQIIFVSTVSLPDTLTSAVNGTFNWVWHVVNSTPTTFQIERYTGEGAWAFGTNGAGVITAQKYGSNLIRIGGVSGLQCDTGYLRDCVLVQDLAVNSKICGRCLYMSDANAERWDMTNVHFQNAIDLVWMKKASASLRECTLFPLVGISRSHIVKENSYGTLIVSDGTYSEMDDVPMVVCLNPDAVDNQKPWIFENCSWLTSHGHINWDCRQPLLLRGELPGDINITALGGHLVTATGTSTYSGAPTRFRGALERLIRIGHANDLGTVSEIRRLTGLSSIPGDAGRNGEGLILGGGDSNDTSIRKAGPIVFDLGILQTAGSGENQTANVLLTQRSTGSFSIEDLNTVGKPSEFKVTAHGLGENDLVRFTTAGFLPSGIHTGIDYWIVPDGADWFWLAHDRNGEKYSLTSGDVGSGSHSITKLTTFCSITRDNNDPNYLNSTRFDVIGPYQLNSTNAQLNVGTLSLGASSLSQFNDTVVAAINTGLGVTDNANHNLPIYNPPANTVLGVTLHVEVEKTDNTTAIVTLDAGFKVVSGSVTQVGSTQPTVNIRDAGAAAWVLDLNTDGASIRFNYTLENNVTFRAQGFVYRRV